VTIPRVDEALPVAEFEIESSGRTPKHMKGDYLNLADLGAAVGIFVLLGDGEAVDATRRFASILVDRPGPPEQGMVRPARSRRSGSRTP
jgi:hypothetical protein